jgi:hypothetical protein
MLSLRGYSINKNSMVERSAQIKDTLLKYNSYASDEWEKAYFDEISGGFNVYHKKHQFASTGGGGEAEKLLVSCWLSITESKLNFCRKMGKKWLI